MGIKTIQNRQKESSLTLDSKFIEKGEDLYLEVQPILKRFDDNGRCVSFDEIAAQYQVEITPSKGITLAEGEEPIKSFGFYKKGRFTSSRENPTLRFKLALEEQAGEVDIKVLREGSVLAYVIAKASY